VKKIDNLPPTLEYFIGDNNFLNELPIFTETLIHLQVSHNKLNKIIKLSKKLQYLAFYGNNIITLPELPNGLNILAGHNNCIKFMPFIPPSVTKITMHNNKLCTECFGKNDEETIKKFNTIYKFNRTFYSQKIKNWIVSKCKCSKLNV
jgi:hypothetical protein